MKTTGSLRYQALMLLPWRMPWLAHAQTADWYRKFKSRPSFRPLLAERMSGIEPPEYYENPDF